MAGPYSGCSVPSNPMDSTVLDQQEMVLFELLLLVLLLLRLLLARLSQLALGWMTRPLESWQASEREC